MVAEVHLIAQKHIELDALKITGAGTSPQRFGFPVVPRPAAKAHQYAPSSPSLG